ncbi:unnamed protein product [Calypogeia fissa]
MYNHCGPKVLRRSGRVVQKRPQYREIPLSNSEDSSDDIQSPPRRPQAVKKGCTSIADISGDSQVSDRDRETPSPEALQKKTSTNMMDSATDSKDSDHDGKETPKESPPRPGPEAVKKGCTTKMDFGSDEFWNIETEPPPRSPPRPGPSEAMKKTSRIILNSSTDSMDSEHGGDTQKEH